MASKSGVSFFLIRTKTIPTTCTQLHLVIESDFPAFYKLMYLLLFTNL